MLASDKSLRITEIFSSLQGESSYAGRPTTFIRLTGCPLRCVYCDSAYAFSGGESISIDGVVGRVERLGNKYVCVTGGEPLAQPLCITLLKALCDRDYTVSLETSGAIDIEHVPDRVKRVVDIKTPASGEVKKNLSSNYLHLRRQDELKFVICDRNDFDWSLAHAKEHSLFDRVDNVFFSPAFDLPDADGENIVQSRVKTELAAWILDSGLPIRFQLQLHKLLWGDEPGR